ncbi:MAG: class II aldolase/adducin family protein [Oligoflexia bacterium]|nr:class II aldolase/adducin family protein [Oligoflexia bacterium]
MKVLKLKKNSSSLNSLKNDILEVGRRVYAKGQVAANDGNISIRLDENHILITPTGISKGFMTAKDLIVVNFDGVVVQGTRKPSSEVFMHLEIYKQRADVESVLHSHPPYATGFAVVGVPLDQYVLPEVIISLGTIPLVEYGTPGTEEFYRPLIPLLKTYDAFLLANHGALTVGNSVYNAYFKMETVEHFAYISFIARQLGKVNVLDDKKVKKLIDLREKYGIKKMVGIPVTDNKSKKNKKK